MNIRIIELTRRTIFSLLLISGYGYADSNIVTAEQAMNSGTVWVDHCLNNGPAPWNPITQNCDKRDRLPDKKYRRYQLNSSLYP